MDGPTKKRLAKLLKKAQGGDPAALHSLCEELESCVRGYLRQQFRDSDVVDDLAQETYTRLLTNLLSIREPLKLRSFVTKIALHVTQDYFRQKYRRKETELEEESATPFELGASLNGASLQMDTSEVVLKQVDLERALVQLPKKARRILMMKVEGYKYEEIAAATGLTVSGVKMQVKRGLEQLRLTLSM